MKNAGWLLSDGIVAAEGCERGIDAGDVDWGCRESVMVTIKTISIVSYNIHCNFSDFVTALQRRVLGSL